MKKKESVVNFGDKKEKKERKKERKKEGTRGRENKGKLK